MLFDVPKKETKTEYTKAYSLVYAFTDNKKLQDKLLEYVQFRIDSCKNKHFRFYSSSIKSFLDSIKIQMEGASDDDIWEAVNLTLSYSAFKLLVPYKNSVSNDYRIHNDTDPYSGVNHTKSMRAF